MQKLERIPKHIGIIMDGNRRWATNKGLIFYKGHEVGVDRMEAVVAQAQEKGIEFLTFWAFSTDNWRRGRLEVNALLRIFRTILTGSMIKRLMANGVKVNVFGELYRFPDDIQKKIEEVAFDSRNNTNITVNLALSYGGRDELVYAFHQLIKEGKTEITQDDVSSHMYTGGQPDVDLIIRTGGEKRLSGFLPWQSVHAELYFTDTYWPDFDENEFEKALADFARRDRRFGR